MKVNFKIEGARELDNLLKQLPPRVAGKVAQKALREGAKPIQAQAKANVEVDTGELKRSIRVTNVKMRKRDSKRVQVGVKGPKGVLAHIIEYGTAAHKIVPKNGKVLAFIQNYARRFAAYVNHPGAKAKPFLRPAADAKAGEALSEIGRVAGEGIEQEAMKLRK